MAGSSGSPSPRLDIWDPLGHIFDGFGFDRCMWGTDWTRAVKLLTYKEGVEAFRITDRLSDGDPRQADGRHAEPHLQLVAVEGLSADTVNAMLARGDEVSVR